MKWSEFEQKLAQRFLERERVLHGILVSVVAGYHLLLIGPPGTSKSKLAKVLCLSIGGRFFRRTVTPTTVPDELFGPLDVKGLTEQGVYRRLMDNTLATADVAVIDEVWKCNSSTLNGLLSVTNEREIDDGHETVPVPLRTLIGTSNEMPQDDSLAALWDRFALRYVVEPIKEVGNFERMLELPEDDDPVEGAPTLEEVKQAGSLLEDVSWDAIRPTLRALWQAARREWKVPVSDRKWKWCLRLVRANALLAGRMAVEPADLLILSDALWEEPDQRLRVRHGLLQLVDPLLREAEELLDAVEEQLDLVRQPMPEAKPEQVMAKVREALQKTERASSRLQEMVDIARGRGQDPSALGRVLQQVRSHRNAMNDHLMDDYLRGGGAR